jgi:hypothetical protein
LGGSLAGADESQRKTKNEPREILSYKTLRRRNDRKSIHDGFLSKLKCDSFQQKPSFPCLNRRVGQEIPGGWQKSRELLLEKLDVPPRASFVRVPCFLTFSLPFPYLGGGIPFLPRFHKNESGFPASKRGAGRVYGKVRISWRR